MGEAMDQGAADAAGAASRRRLALLGLAVGVWALLPPYIGPELSTDPRVEFADHVVPAAVIVAICLAVLAAGDRLPRGGTAMFAAGLGVALAGMWMVATHVPLLAQVTRDEAPFGAALWHSVPGFVVLAFGAAWALRAPVEADSGTRATGRERRRGPEEAPRSEP